MAGYGIIKKVRNKKKKKNKKKNRVNSMKNKYGR